MLRDLVRDGIVKVEHVVSAEQLADGLTKFLKPDLHTRAMNGWKLLELKPLIKMEEPNKEMERNEARSRSMRVNAYGFPMGSTTPYGIPIWHARRGLDHEEWEGESMAFTLDLLGWHLGVALKVRDFPRIQSPLGRVWHFP